MTAERMRIRRRPGEVDTLWEAWALACEDAADAYLDWESADREDRADAYCAYLAAVDRETAAMEFLRTHAAGAAKEAVA
jgi:hypothetical protein